MAALAMGAAFGLSACQPSEYAAQHHGHHTTVVHHTVVHHTVVHHVVVHRVVPKRTVTLRKGRR